MSFNHEDRPLPKTSTLFPHLHSNPAILPSSLDPFTITTTTGFLPLRAPQLNLPPKFSALRSLLENLPVVRQDGTAGLLADFKLGSFIDGGILPDLADALDDLATENDEPDLMAITAAFRDYAFLASAYLLEPCWEKWSKNREGGYGLGRQILPSCIAGPLVKSAAL
jgi:indoleamine 2,3-dioxygenase